MGCWHKGQAAWFGGIVQSRPGIVETRRVSGRPNPRCCPSRRCRHGALRVQGAGGARRAGSSATFVRCRQPRAAMRIEPVTLRGRHVVLEPLRLEHAEELWEQAAERELW